MMERTEGQGVPFTPRNQYGTGDFPSDLGSPISTFASTPNTSPSLIASPKTPSFEELAGTQVTDDEAEPVQANLKTKSEDPLVKYLIGDISDSEEENQQVDSIADINTENKQNTNSVFACSKINKN